MLVKVVFIGGNEILGILGRIQASSRWTAFLGLGTSDRAGKLHKSARNRHSTRLLKMCGDASGNCGAEMKANLAANMSLDNGRFAMNVGCPRQRSVAIH